MTCYLSSFPLEMCQFVWDLVLCVGGVGLVKFAIALVLMLEKQLMEYDDACDLTEFFSSLKELEIFNRYLSIRDIVRNAYMLKIEKSDLEELS